MIDFSQTFEPDPDVVCTELDAKEAVLLHLQTKKYYSLNETGLRIWKMLSSGHTASDVIKGLQAEFEVTAEKARESVIVLMNELISEKLLHSRT